MRKLVVLLVLLVVNSAYAQDATRDNPDICKLDNEIARQSMKLGRPPSWFISIHPDGDRVGVIHSGNHVYNFSKDPNNLPDDYVPYYKVPGGVDGVFTPDGWFITQPTEGGGSFYDFEKIEKNVKNGQLDNSNAPVVGTAGVGSVYQSIGQLEKNEEQTYAKYMYIADPNPVNQNSPLEYAVVTAKRDPNTGEKSITSVKNGILCEGKFAEATTPMISRDGKYLSILNKDTNTTQIYKVDTNGLCEMVVDVGVPTGKVSFDFSETNQRKITFHVDHYGTNDGWFSQPGGEVIKNSYVMDLEINADSNSPAGETWDIKNYTRLSHHKHKGEGTYYPRFDKKGNIVAVNAYQKPNGIMKYQLDRYNLESSNSVEYDKALFDPTISAAMCSPELRTGMNKLYALGSLFEKICMYNSQNSSRYKDALLIAQTMNHKACKNLLESYWNNTKNSLTFNSNKIKNEHIDKDLILSYTHEDLMSVCPKPVENVNPVTPVNTITADDEEESPKEAFLRVCGGCHLPGDKDVSTIFKNASGELNTGDLYNDGVLYRGLTPYYILYGLDRVSNRDHYMQGHAMPPQNPMQPNEEKKIANFMLEQYEQQGGDTNNEDYKAFKQKYESNGVFNFGN